MIKVLEVSTNGDYGMVIFEDSNLVPVDIWNQAKENGGKLSLETDEDEFYFIAREFNDDSLEALEWAKSMEDYDDSKHNSWIIIQN